MAREAPSLTAPVVSRLGPGEQPAADQLGIGPQQAQAVAVTVSGRLVLAEVGECRLELHVAREGLTARAHERILDVVADSGDRAEADQLVPAKLRVRRAHRPVLRMPERQSHLAPYPQERAIGPLRVVRVRARVVEEIELEELDPLVFEVEQGPFDAAAIRIQLTDAPRGVLSSAERVAGSPVVLPVGPGAVSHGHRALPAAAAGGLLANLPLEPLRALFGNQPDAAERKLDARDQVGRLARASARAERCSEHEQTAQAAEHGPNPPIVPPRRGSCPPPSRR